MAIDTRDRRASTLAEGLPWAEILPNPGGPLDQAARQQMGLMYSGILAAALVVIYSAEAVVSSTSADVTVRFTSADYEVS